MTASIGLFQAYGIELEYMIVHRDTLAVLPISDRLLESAAGSLVSDYEDGDITWSNELVLHVLEFKTTEPARHLHDLENSFARSIRKANHALEKFSAMLLPTAMHPFMNPSQETQIWPHDNNEVYDAYNRIFGCKGHGWSNLQSMHINLPFKNDDEFRKLHTAIRLLLPILPALTASSPVVEGQRNGALDNRLMFYQKNQKAVPSIAGEVIPELVISKQDYQEKILSRIYQDISPHDPDEILRDDWLNSRGAIARFGRQTIEIRVLDTQETPDADISLAELIGATLQLMVSEKLMPFEQQVRFSTSELKAIFDEVADKAESALISNTEYLKAFGIEGSLTAQAFWRSILQRVSAAGLMSARHQSVARQVIESGSLATRIAKALRNDSSEENIKRVYRELANCLAQGSLFRIEDPLRSKNESQEKLHHPDL